MAVTPPVTVILPAHNAERTIAPAITSTLNQSYEDFELWVLENGSTDRTAEIARSFADPRVKVFELGPVGFQSAIQYAIENASSDWLARMDADDLMFPNRLKRQMDVIRESPELVFVGTAFASLTPFGHIIEPVILQESGEVDAPRLAWGRFFADPSTIFSRRVALDVGGVDPEFTTGDVPLLFRMLHRGKGWEIAEPLYLYRIQPGSMSKGKDAYLQSLRARAKYQPDALTHYAKLPPEPSTFWYGVAVIEFSAGNIMAARRAISFFERQTGSLARRMRWLSRLGRLGYALYRWRNPSRFSYRRRPDWEEVFAPLLGSSAVRLHFSGNSLSPP